MNWFTLLTCGLAVGLIVSLLVIGHRLHLNNKPYWRRPIIVAGLVLIGIVAGLLPLKTLDPNQLTTDSDVIFLVDTTYSMHALDGRDNDTRLSDVKHDLRTFAQNLQGSRLGIITYEKTASIYLPLTTTYSDLDTAADTLNGGAYLFSRNDPSLTGALDFTKAYLQKVRAADVTRHQVVILMTDGELTGQTDSANSVKAAAERLAAVADATVIIGYGTNAGAKMPEIEMSFTGNGALTRKPNRFAKALINGKFDDVISKRNEDQLRAVASSLRGTYVPAQDLGQVTTTVVNARKQAAAKQAASPESQAIRQNLLHIPIAIIILAWLFVTEILGISRVRQLIGSWRHS